MGSVLTDRPLRVGLVLDGPEAPAWSALVAEGLARAPEVELCVLVCVNGPVPQPPVGLLWRLYRYIDRAVFRRLGDLRNPHTPVDLALRLPDCHRVVVTVTTQRDASEVAAALDLRDAHMVVNLSSRLSSIELTAAAAHLGVWFCHQGEGKERAAAWYGAALREMYRDLSVIPSLLGRFPGRGQSAEVVSQMWSAVNRYSLYRTESRLLWKTAAFVADRVRWVARELAAGGKVEALRRDHRTAEPRLRDHHLVIFLGTLLARMLCKSARRLLFRDPWTIGIRQRRAVGAADYAAVDVRGFTPVPSCAGGYLADPFISEVRGKSFLFCEEYLLRAKK